jgi:hypothetical protein
MRRFVTLMVTEIELVQDSEAHADNYEENLANVVKDAAKKLLLRAVADTKVVKVQVAEIKGVISL